MNSDNAKKVVLVTGASGGIGAAIVRAFEAKGYTVAAHCNKNDAGFKHVYRADFTKPEEIAEVCDKVKKDLGPIDVLVNNAGIGIQKLFQDISYDDWRKTFAINIDAMFLTTKAVLPDMIHNKAGKIINISSMWGEVGASCEVDYSSSKAAVIGFTKALAKEVGPSGINVNCVAPGLVDTKMNGHLSKEDIDEIVAETPLGRIGTPEDIANAVLFLAGNEADFITGQVLGVNGGLVI